MKRIAVLASGEGTNLQTIINSIENGHIKGRLALVVSNYSDSGALKRAAKNNIRNIFINPKEFKNRDDYDRELLKEMQKENIELVVLAGYMRLLSPVLINFYRGKIMNIHPSLLPAFPGLDAVKQALRYGVKVTGCTVHFVDEGLDTGPIIIQESVPVLQEDDEETLHQRVHAAEYRNYPRAIDLFCQGKIKIEGRRCVIYEKEK